MGFSDNKILLEDSLGTTAGDVLVGLDNLSQGQIVKLLIENQKAHHSDLLRIRKSLSGVASKVEALYGELHGNKTNPGFIKEIRDQSGKIDKLEKALDNLSDQITDISKAIIGDTKYDTPGLLKRVKSLEKFKSAIQRYIAIGVGASAVLGFLLTRLVNFIIRYFSSAP